MKADMQDNKSLIVKNLLLIFAIIIASVLLIRGLTAGETLAEYAENNNIPVYAEGAGADETEDIDETVEDAKPADDNQ